MDWKNRFGYFKYDLTGKKYNSVQKVFVILYLEKKKKKNMGTRVQLSTLPRVFNKIFIHRDEEQFFALQQFSRSIRLV